ncbi:XRE family transcriptional regulator [Arthrobacter sp. zg-Y40]|uniref:XRE family transcriptional regulator n=1 Tax=unclassified Arthrobacter TaxID=235627 RepID=UPI001D14B911|nr:MULTISPECIES: XRE family transcriptional regulator [unclassified Arthrobacter]MCC3280155.1 XRE family transcriptional regulator [Arthrobacter sp. zg-Y40]MDK1328492.1 XRE family transcriptional regulator [Arthrobacter sp. zg-Y1143]
MGKSFGEKLRTARLERHLTQAQLGNGTFRARDISLLETGRREPAPGAPALLSRRLESGRGGAASGTCEDGALFLELSAWQALDERDYGGACVLAGRAADAAAAAGDQQSWWAMTHLAARCLQAMCRVREAAGKASGLLRHPLAAEHPGLRAQAEILLARAYQGMGELGEAVAHARAALRSVQGSAPGALLFLEACEALSSALAEFGQIDEAWEYCRTLVLPLLETGLPREARGRALWAVGNVAFRRGDYGTALRYHRNAAVLLLPGSDVELWARFSSSTAAMRLAAGIHDAETLACIEHAEVGMAVVGLPAAEQLELIHSRGLWLDLNGEHIQAVDILSEVYAHREELPPQAAGEVALHLGLALARTGATDAGSLYLADSEQSFRAVGAGDRAAHAAALAHEITTR